MASLCAALDSHTSTPSRNQGEKGHTQYKWISPNSNAEEAFVQLYFQMVRATSVSDSSLFRDKIRHILTECYTQHSRNYDVSKYLFKLIGHTRDIVDGKGERTLSYAGVIEWYRVNPIMAQRLFDSFIYSLDSNGEKTDGHQYGGWNDVKYFCRYVREVTNNRDHPMIEYAISAISDQISKDIGAYNEKKKVSLAVRHMPKQGKANGWLYRKIAMNIYPYHTTARTNESHERAISKSECQLRKMYTQINRNALNTPQVFMASGPKGEGEWDKLDFGKMTSKTIRSYPKAFMNITKKGEERSLEEHRKMCAIFYRAHMDSVSRGEAKVNGKRCNPYELVKDVFNLSNNSICATEEARINGQWKNKMSTALQLGNFIPLVDVSGSMTSDEGRPLYSAIGLGIRLSETSRIKNRVLTFHESPSWVVLNEHDTFCEKVRKIQHASWGMTTNFYKAMKLILTTIVQHKIPPSEVSDMVLAVFSDMQMDVGVSDGNTVSEEIRNMYHDAGMKSRYGEPYTPPHILWWNLRTTSGFPEISSTENTTMLSGFSDALLNAFFEKGTDALNDFTPKKMIYDILDKERYAPLEHLFYK